MTTDLVRSQVCRSLDEILETVDEWEAAMRAKGWEEQSSTS